MKFVRNDVFILVLYAVNILLVFFDCNSGLMGTNEFKKYSICVLVVGIALLFEGSIKLYSQSKSMKVMVIGALAQLGVVAFAIFIAPITVFIISVMFYKTKLGLLVSIDDNGWLIALISSIIITVSTIKLIISVYTRYYMPKLYYRR